MKRIFRNIFLVLTALAIVFPIVFSVTVPTTTHALTPTQEDTQAAGQSDSGGVLGKIGETIGDVLVYIFTHIAIIGIQAALFVLAVFGTLLDVALLMTFNMGAILNQGTAIGKAVAEGWGIFRDIANLMFIAGMVWASFAMILQIQMPGGNTGKFIANIIIAALLVNFSYFFTGVIIDASNNFSRLIYQEGILNGQSVQLRSVSLIDYIKYASGNESGVTQQASSGSSGGGGVIQATGGFIGSQFLRETKLMSLFDPEGLRKQATFGNINTQIFIISMVAGVLLTATIQAFASLFFTIIARFGILILLLIMSPLIVFRLMGIKPFSDWGDQWWKALWSQVVFLPIFIFLIAISFRLVHGFIQTLGASNLSFSGLMAKPTGADWNAAFGLLLIAIMALMLLKMSKTVAESIAQGKDAEFPLMKTVSGWQAMVAGWGTATGGVGTRAAQLPAAAARTAVGSLLRAVDSLPGVRAGRETVASGVKGIRATFDRGYRYEYERERTAKEKLPGDITSALSDIRRFKSAKEAARDARDVNGEARAQEAADRAKEQLKKHVARMFDDLGARKTADALRDFSGDDQRTALDALDDEKAREVYNELVKKGALKQKGEPGSTQTTKESSGADAPVKQTFARVIEELRGLEAEERRIFLREREAELRDEAREADNAQKIVGAIREKGGAGSAGKEIPAGVIISEGVVNEDVIRSLDDNDIVELKGRRDISDEDFAKVQRAHRAAKRRGFTPSPSDIARPAEKLESGESEGGEPKP